MVMSGLPAARFVVLAKRPGQPPQVISRLLPEDRAQDLLDRMFSSSGVRAHQYALAELALVVQYR